MRVQIVDPPAFTPPYDRALCAALGAAGAEVELVTSHFEYGPVRRRRRLRGQRALLPPLHRARPRGARAPRPAPRRARAGDAAAARRTPPRADVVHLQWLSVPDLDRFLLPPRPRAFTVHYPLPTSSSARAAASGRCSSRMDALVAHSEYGAAELRDLVGDPTRVHAIPHGAFEHLAHQPRGACRCRPSSPRSRGRWSSASG